MSIFLRVQRLHFPCELEKKLQQIDASYAPIHKYNFFRMLAITREEAVLNCIEKYVVYLRAEREAVRFRKVGQVLLPETVRIFQLQYNGDKSRLSCRGGVDSRR